MKRMLKILRWAGCALGVFVVVAATVVATGYAYWKRHEESGAVLGRRYAIPATVSPVAHAIGERMYPLASMLGWLVKLPPTAEGIAAFNDKGLAKVEERNAPILQKLGVTISKATLGGVNVVETLPPAYRDDGTLLVHVHVHGGGWVLGSASSSSVMNAMVAISTGRRVVSIDYTLATRAQWPQITDEIIAVYKALLAQGYPAERIGMYGDSAGGNIVAGSVLKLRDQGLPMPAAVLLLSPGLDLTRTGDTMVSLKDADPVLYDDAMLETAMSLYAPRADWANPYVSPVYGDFGKGYPPVLLQVGTRERLLSDTVRFYQALKVAGGQATLDIYEGMPHVFQGYMTDAPEQKAAFDEAKRFWAAHLRARK
ncbi:MAG: alpha/beta hydrolase [Solimonas sp.]